MREEQVDERRVVRAVAAVLRRGERVIGREDARDRLHVLAQMHHAHRQRDRVALHVIGMAVAVPSLERAAQRVLHAGGEAEPLDEHHRHFATGLEVVDDPLLGRLLEHADGLRRVLRRLARRRERDHIAHDLGRVGGVVDQRLAANRDFVAEHGGDFVRVAGAADVAEQGHPVGGFAHVRLESRALAHPRREQARPKL